MEIFETKLGLGWVDFIIWYHAVYNELQWALQHEFINSNFTLFTFITKVYIQKEVFVSFLYEIIPILMILFLA